MEKQGPGSLGVLPESYMDAENVLDMKTEDDITDDCVNRKETYLIDSISICLSGKQKWEVFLCVLQRTLYIWDFRESTL